MTARCDLLVINPSARARIYQGLGDGLTAIEPPLWARLIAGYALDRGYEVRLVDAEAEGANPQALARLVSESRPTLVAVVVFGHQPSASTQQMVGARAACEAIRDAEPSVPILMLGGHVSALPERTLVEEPVDFVCAGEGPITVVSLLEALREGVEDALEKVPGLVFRGAHGSVSRNPAAPLIEDLDRDLAGDVWHLLPMDRYRAHNWQCFDDPDARQPYASIYTSLGCPYRCHFCCINAPFATNRYRRRSPASVVAEIDRLYERYGVRTFKIVDEMFVLNDRHVTGICELLQAKTYVDELNIWAYARVDTIKPERLALLRSAGFRWLAIGIESGSELVRDGAEKSFADDEICDIVRAVQMAGIHVIGNFIFGLPDDDLDSMRATLQLAKQLNCEFANFYSAMAYPGSPLYQEAIANQWALPQAWSGFSQHSYDCTPLPTRHVPAWQVLEFRDRAFDEYFGSERYRGMLAQRFGDAALRELDAMCSHSLPRRLLEEHAGVEAS